MRQDSKYSGGNLTYQNQNDNTSTLLNADRDQIYTVPVTPTPSATPDTSTVGVESGVYYIASNLDEHKMLDVSGESKKSGANVVLWDLTAQTNQQFIFTKSGDTYTIQAKHSGQGLVAPNKKGGEVIQSDTLSPTKFYLEDAGNGAVRFKTKDGYYLGISGGKTENGTSLIVWTKSNDGSQNFILKKPFGE